MGEALAARTLRWRDRLRAVDAATLDTGLSGEGARLAWAAALEGLTDAALADAWAEPGEPFAHATFVAARTVFTAPIEWLAVLLGRGTTVTLKHPSALAGAAPALVAAAHAEGLGLRATSERGNPGSELVIVMGDDATVAEVRQAAPPSARVLGFGHRFSVAYTRAPERVVADVVLHDTRGCMSPVAVFTPLPLAEAVERLSDALADATARVPVGAVSDVEGATIRQRGALARVVGVARAGEGWSVHGLPAARFHPVALPRSVAVHEVADLAAARTAVGDHARALSSVGVDDEAVWPGVRTARVGTMQRPPLRRLHDGVDWLRATLR